VESLKQHFQEIRDFVKKKDLLSRINLEGVEVPFWEAEIVWRSPDKQHELHIDKSRGKDGNERWCTKRIMLKKVSEISYNLHDIFGISESTNYDKIIYRHVFLDARDDSKQDFWTACAVYENFGGYGKLLKIREWSSFFRNEEYKKMSDNEYGSLYRNEQIKNGIPNVDELPPYIYIDATIDKFIDQINRRDFSQPVLVARKVTKEEVKNIKRRENKSQ